MSSLSTAPPLLPANWLLWIFLQPMQDGVIVPRAQPEPYTNFLSPLVVTDNPGNNSIDISVSLSGLVAYGGVTANPTYTVPASSIHGFDTTAAPVTLHSPPIGAGGGLDGCEFGVFDAARNVETNGATLSDATNGYSFQNPIDLELYATLAWGTGSGGGPNPNMPKGFMARWMRVRCANFNGGVPYWQCTGKIG